MIDSENFAKRLKLIMETYQISATQFAEILNVQRSSISHLLSGRNKPSLEFVLKVLKSFTDVELYWLLNGDGCYPKVENIQPAPTLVSSKRTKEPINASNEENTPIKNIDISNSNNEIERIVVFFKNGSFKNFLP